LTGLFLRPKRRLKKLVDEGEYSEALELGKRLEKKHSKDTDFLFIMGSTYYILEEADESLHYLNRVLEINEYDKEALVLKTSCRML
jgi:tetratricopeptide (TPR) repeat protein